MIAAKPADPPTSLEGGVDPDYPDLETSGVQAAREEGTQDTSSNGPPNLNEINPLLTTEDHNTSKTPAVSAHLRGLATTSDGAPAAPTGIHPQHGETGLAAAAPEQGESGQAKAKDDTAITIDVEALGIAGTAEAGPLGEGGEGATSSKKRKDRDADGSEKPKKKKKRKTKTPSPDAIAASLFTLGRIIRLRPRDDDDLASAVSEEEPPLSTFFSDSRALELGPRFARGRAFVYKAGWVTRDEETGAWVRTGRYTVAVKIRLQVSTVTNFWRWGSGKKGCAKVIGESRGRESGWNWLGAGRGVKLVALRSSGVGRREEESTMSGGKKSSI